MARWLIELKGDKFDLEEFPKNFPNGDYYVFEEKDSYYVSGDGFEALPDAASVRDLCNEKLETWFGIVLLSLNSLRKPNIGGVIREEDDGSRKNTYFMIAEPLQLRSKCSATLTTVGGTAATPERLTKAQKFDIAINLESNLAIANTLISSSDYTWGSLYTAMESIERFTGQSIYSMDGLSLREKDLFKHTANSFQALGKDARHGDKGQTPPQIAMLKGEAYSFLLRLFTKALEMAVQKHGIQ